VKNKILWLLVSALMAISLVLASCAGEEEEEEEVTVPTEEEEVVIPTEEEEVVIPPEGNWWDRWGKPEYGGTFTSRLVSDPTYWDPYYGTVGGMYLEHVAALGWMVVPPETWEFRTRYNPIEYLTNVLAESWEIAPDWQSITFHIRKGVHWQDLPPLNGRELTAYDVEYSWHRVFGLGSGFTGPSPFANVRLYGPPESVIATDKYTVTVRLPNPSVANIRMILDDTPYAYTVPREVIEQYGDMNDWENVVGSGPFIIEDYVAGTAVTYVKNPDYWGYDEQYPENRLPYVDKVKQLIIPDSSTAIAALRTGKIDNLGGLSWELAESIYKTNPELVQDYYASGTMTVVMPVDREPYSDIRVRKALQMSIDLKTIAETYYGGYVDGTPVGQTMYDGYRAEYGDWPQEVKDGYAYNPEGAKQLLAEAGYPNGFKCTVTMSSSQDVDLMQILKAYFSDIGVDMTIETFEGPTWYAYVYAGKAEMCTTLWSAWSFISPVDRFVQLTSTHRDANAHHLNDATFDEMVSKIKATLAEEEVKRLCREADLYAISKNWMITVQPVPSFSFTQPWVKRHLPTADVLLGYKMARIWIDHDIKKAMGR